jgi:hypothetical protein
MVMLNKVVTAYNNGTQGKIIMPVNSIGMEFYVISKDELDRNLEFMERSAIRLKIQEDEILKLKQDLEQFKNISNSRITYLERIISMTTEKSHIENKNDENENND